MKITLLTGKTFDIERKISFPIKVVRSARYKKLSLRIDTKLRMPILNVPTFCPTTSAVNFANQNRKWIEDHLNRLAESKTFAPGDIISLFGEQTEICHFPELKSGVIWQNGKLMVSGGIEFLPRRVKDFIYEETRRRLLHLSREKAQQIGCSVNRVVIKDTKSRWGSCSSLNNINYNWRIALAPVPVIDYLVAHEVSHLLHRNHGSAFWQCVEKLAPDAASAREWLRQNSRSLYAYA